PETMYSALEAGGRLTDTVLSARRSSAVLPGAPVVGLVGGATERSMSLTPFISSIDSSRSFAVSRIVWYRLSGSFTRHLRMRRCNSGEAEGLKSVMAGAGSWMIL